MKKSENGLKRCAWVSDDPIYIAYHDHEWGVPIYDDQLLFEFLVLEGAQAGLSWITVLKKRDRYREVFDNFNPKKIINYTPKKIAQLMKDPGIIRNRLKIEASIINANAFLEVRKEWKSFSAYIWHFVKDKPIQHNWRSIKQIPASDIISEQISKDLKKRGFKFVGSTICYAFMQAVGIVNDHTTDCYRHKEVLRIGRVKDK